MSNPFSETWRWLVGGGDPESNSPKSVPPEASALSAVDEVLRQMLRQHGVDAKADGGEWILLPEGRRLRSRIHQRDPHQGVATVQLDVLLELASGTTLIESFAGVGELPQAAVFDALENFRAGSLHVLIAAFCGATTEQVDIEEWIIAGRKRRVVLGPVGVRGEPPVEGSELVKPLRDWEEFIRHSDLGAGTHWLRLFYAQQAGEMLACEVLRDNDVWPEAQAAAEGANWARGEEFYSVRMFLVVMDADP